MTGSGIYPSNLLVVDRLLKVTNGDVVVGLMDGDFILRTYIKKGNDEYLMPDNPKFSAIKRNAESEFTNCSTYRFKSKKEKEYMH